MKAGWEVKPLGEVSKVAYGYTAKASPNEVGPKFLRITDIQDGQVDWETVPFCPIAAKDHQKHELEAGNIVFARTGATTGKSFLITNPPDAVCASYLIKVSNLSDAIDPRFLSLYFNTDQYWDDVDAGTEGAAQGGFNASKLKALAIPIPPLEEQKRIVAVLDAAFEGLTRAKENAETNLQNARELFEASLGRLLSERGGAWACRKVSDCFKLKSGDGLTAKNMVHGPYEVYGGNGVAGFHNESNLSGENVIIGRVGALCGNARLIVNEIWLTDNAFLVTDFQQDFDLTFLALLLNHMNLRSFARQTAQPVISNSSLKDVVLDFPESVQEQKAMAEKLLEIESEVEGLETQYQTKLTDIDDLRQSLLQKAFAGELT